MKTYTALLLLALAGCEARVQITQSSNTNAPIPEARVLDTNQWLSIYHIWRCDDGSYEVRSSIEMVAKVQTLEEARDRKYDRALHLAEQFSDDTKRKEFMKLPDCGKRIE